MIDASFETDRESTRERTFVGRADVLVNAFDDRCPAFLVVGEAGVGKTRLLAEMRKVYARSRSCRSVSVVVHEADLRDPLEAVRELCTSLAADGTLDAASIARVARSEDTFTARFAREVLAAATADGPLLLQIDDVHRADRATLDAFAYLIERLQDAPIRWHFAARESEAVTAAFEAAERTNLLRTHALPLFSLDETAAFLRTRAAFDGDEGAARIHARSGGNALFIELLLATGVSAPASLRAVVSERLSDLSETAGKFALWIATGSGASLERTVLAAGLSIVSGRTALDELRDRGLVEQGAGEDRLHFRHDLLREAIVNGASESARRACFDGWLAHAADGRERLRCLEGAGRWNDFIGELLDEGWARAELGQSTDACALADRVLVVAERGDPRRYEAYALRARGEVAAGRPAEASADFARFLDGAERLTFAAFALAFARYAVAAAPEFGIGALPELADHWRRARQGAVEAYPSLGHALAIARYRSGDVAGALEVVRTTREVPADGIDRLRQDMWENYLAAQIDGAPSLPSFFGIDRLSAAVDRAEALGATSEAARACFMIAFATHRSGDLVSAERFCLRGLAQPEPKPRGVVAALRSQLCEYLILQGNAWAALGLMLETLEDAKTLTSDARANVSALLAYAQALTGSVAAARRTLAPLEIGTLAPVVRGAVETIRGCVAEIATTDVAEAVRAYDSVIAHATVAETSLQYALCGRARIAFTAGDRKTLDTLHARAARDHAHDGLRRVAAVIDVLRATLDGEASAVGRVPKAAAGLQSAFDDAATRLVFGERARDRASLLYALERFSAIGTAPLVDRTRAAARACGLRLGATRRDVLRLTDRDRAVAMGVAAGQTNAEIARDLHLSGRTIEKYVSGLLHRFDLHSRVEIATLVASGGLANY